MELADLFFYRIQSLLVTHNLSQAQKVLIDYSTVISKSDDLLLVIQLKFITCLVNLYLDYSKYEKEIKQLLTQLKPFKVSEVNFYMIIFQIHKERARSHYSRYIE